MRRSHRMLQTRGGLPWLPWTRRQAPRPRLGWRDSRRRRRRARAHRREAWIRWRGCGMQPRFVLLRARAGEYPWCRSGRWRARRRAAGCRCRSSSSTEGLQMVPGKDEGVDIGQEEGRVEDKEHTRGKTEHPRPRRAVGR
jgi:hypothetical protein